MGDAPDPFVKVRRYAFRDVGRFYDLTLVERVVLFVLIDEADWRTAEWSGTFLDLAESVGAHRQTMPAAMRGLERAGLVEVLVPFGGRGRDGRVYVAVYDSIVVPERKRSALIVRRGEPVPLRPVDLSVRDRRRDAEVRVLHAVPDEATDDASAQIGAQDTDGCDGNPSQASAQMRAQEPGSCDGKPSQAREALRRSCDGPVTALRRSSDGQAVTGDAVTSTDAHTRDRELAEKAEIVRQPSYAVTVCTRCGAPAEHETDTGELRCATCTDTHTNTPADVHAITINALLDAFPGTTIDTDP